MTKKALFLKFFQKVRVINLTQGGAIHDSENREGQRNLHIHVLLTMRPLTQDGKWGAKQRKVYILDKDGNKIRNWNGKGYRSTTEFTT